MNSRNIDKKKSALSLYFVLLVAFFLVFLLPFIIPSISKTGSGSSALGFNNTLSIIGVYVSIFLLIARNKLLHIDLSRYTARMFSWKNERSFIAPGNKIFWVCLFIYVCIAVFGFFVFDSPGFHGEDEQFIKRIDLIQMGKTAYKDFWFPYGPANIYIPAFSMKAFSVLGATARSSYYLFYGAMLIIGLYMLYYFVDHLDIEQKHKNILFFAAAILSLNLNAGAQYTLIRFILPFFCLISIHKLIKQKLNDRTFLNESLFYIVPCFYIMLNLLFYTEIGIAFFASLALYLVAGSLSGNKKYLLALMLCSLIFTAYFVMVPKGFLQDVIDYRSGGNNFPVFPSPMVLLYLASLFVLIPAFLGGIFKRKNVDRSFHVAFAALCMLMLFGAFGRSDSGHVFDYGLGTFIGAAGFISCLSKRYFKYYMAAFILICAFALSLVAIETTAGKVSYSLYTHIGQRLFSEGQILKYSRIVGLDDNKTRNLLLLEKMNSSIDYSVLGKYPSIATPLMIDHALYNELIRTGKFVPEYYLDMINIDNENELAKKISDLNRSKYVLIANKDLALHGTKPDLAAQGKDLSMILCFPVKYAPIKAPFDAKKGFLEYIALEYHPIEVFGQYTILEKRGTEK